MEPQDGFSHARMDRLFRDVAARHPTRPALVADGLRLTFAALDTRTDRLADALHAAGIGRGAIVATLLMNGVPMIELLIAASKIGATVAALNWRLAAAELAVVVRDADPALVFVSESLENLASAAGPNRRVVVVRDGDPDALVGWDAGPSATRGPAEPIEPAASDRWYLIYTSGTTGRPKGCQHSQSSYCVNALSLMGWSGVKEDDRCLLQLPLFHVAGLSLFLSWHAAGACVVVPSRVLEPEPLLRLVSDERITIQIMPVLGAREVVEVQNRLKLPLALRLVVGGGGLTPRALIDAWRTTFGVDLIFGYGQSEAGGFACFARLAEQLERPTSCGKPLPHLDARIVDHEGHEVAAGAHGELLLRGASVTVGYRGMPEETGRLLEGGWLHTGDLFWRDADGFLHFAGRIKELIKTGGENVYPGEVEPVLREHPAVADCCVAGVRDRRFGEAVKAFVVLKRGQALTPGDVADWCRDRLAGYKRPRYVEFLDAIPRDFQGKPQRKMLSARPVLPDQEVRASAPG